MSTPTPLEDAAILAYMAEDADGLAARHTP